MNQSSTLRASKTTIALNKVKTFFSKPHNVILLLLGIVLTFTTVAPIVAIVGRHLQNPRRHHRRAPDRAGIPTVFEELH